MAEYSNTPSAIVEPTRELSAEDEAVMERMMMAAIEAEARKPSTCW
jgi:hypothetical protein